VGQKMVGQFGTDGNLSSSATAVHPTPAEIKPADSAQNTQLIDQPRRFGLGGIGLLTLPGAICSERASPDWEGDPNSDASGSADQPSGIPRSLIAHTKIFMLINSAC